MFIIIAKNLPACLQVAPKRHGALMALIGTAGK